MIPHTLTFSTQFAETIPHFRMAMLEVKVKNSPYCMELQRAIEQSIGELVLQYRLEDIKSIPAIYHTREAYKLLGKDPNRYRPAGEQLLRRIVSGKGLYSINALVDMGNLISIKTGYSLGIFHAPAVGREVLLRRGEAEDTFEGIGRGRLNVEGLPLYVDEVGPFANPTSDSERTKVRLNTTEALIFINSYLPTKEGAEEKLYQAVEYTEELLRRFLAASELTSSYYCADSYLASTSCIN